jgi:hypothetical protein
MSLYKESQEILIDDEPVNLVGDNVITMTGEDPSENSDVIQVSEGNESLKQPVVEIEITFDSDMPGVPRKEVEKIKLEPEEKELEVSEADDEKDEDKAEDKKPNSIWDWQTQGLPNFLNWVNERFLNVPYHSGRDTAGIERAISYLKAVDSEISKAMRSDKDGQLDFAKIVDVRSKIENGIQALKTQLDRLVKPRKKADEEIELIIKEGEDTSEQIVKEAQKAVPLKGNYVNVPLLIAGIARICINSTISAGHSMEDSFEKLAKKFKLDDREKFQVVLLIRDMGFPIRADRFSLLEEQIDPTESQGLDYMTNYPS